MFKKTPYKPTRHRPPQTVLANYTARWVDVDELIYLNFQPLELVSRYRDPQAQVIDNYSYYFNLIRDQTYWWLNSHFFPNNS